MTKKNKNQNRRVVVTGLGVVSSLGIGWEEFWRNLMAGKSGISEITTFDTSQYDRHMGGEVKNFDPNQFIAKSRVKHLGRASQMAIAASKLALKDAKLDLDQINRNEVAVYIGTTTGEIQLLERFHDEYSLHSRYLNLHLTPIFPANSLSSNIARDFRLTNTNNIFTTACASGNYSIGQALDQIKFSNVDYAFVGGSDAFSRLVFTGFWRLFLIASEKCQPFDKNRTGMIPGEGAGMLFLETLDSALKRKAPIYAEILGYGMSCNAQDMTEASAEGMAKAMQKSLKNAGVDIHDVDYISAHGTGTKTNDKAECAAIKSVFKEETRRIPASSIKSMLGHTMGASAAFEAIACCLAIKNNEIPPTINYETKDPECDIDCVPNKGRKHKVKIALNNSSAFGGNNCCVVMDKFTL